MGYSFGSNLVSQGGAFMARRNKVELFEEIRREYEFGVGTIAGVAQQFGVHRRTVRQAIQSALPPPRKVSQRKCPKLDGVRAFMDDILQADQQVPRKQRPTARRIYLRLREELPAQAIAERTVRQYVQAWHAQRGESRSTVCIPQAYEFGVEAQVDWYAAVAEIDGERQTVQIFALRSMASGAAFHRAYLRATQQAFLEAHQLAFHYFGGVFRRLRSDNLKSAVKKILRGHRREETERFVAFRSHWQFESSFCNPAAGHEKGGVEGEIGYFRRNHLVPVPQVTSLAELNDQLLQACRADGGRVIGERAQSVGTLLKAEQAHLLPPPAEDFEWAEEQFCRVDGKGCVQVRTNWYSMSLRPGVQARVRVLAASVEIHHQGRLLARHPRCYERRQQVLELEHYLDVRAQKPGAFPGSKPLQQWRAAGRWTATYDRFWSGLQQRYGAQAGTRLMIELLPLGRQHGYARLSQALEQATALGATDAAAVRYLLTASELPQEMTPLLALEEVKRHEFYTRPLPQLSSYDELLGPSVWRTTPAALEVTP
jgi:transposase